MDQQTRDLVAGYLDAKAALSIAADKTIWARNQRLAVPRFHSPEAAAHYYQVEMGNPYTGDPLYGALDNYIDPELLQAGIEAGPDAWSRLWIDCDDVAGWYLHAVAGIPGCSARIVTLVDTEITFRNGSHVILAGELGGQAFALDTNGYRPLPDLEEATLCSVWAAIYAEAGYTYAGAVETPYPFAPAA